ncbi:MAG: hypothetical protein VKM98_06490 [Cyanobacteriota bacterium]|nr:hypothetical protein [Cyanobacteriota bacterium]
MTHGPNRKPRASASGTDVCPSCGGSGTLRLGDQSFRTCLDCLGQGRLPAVEPATTTAAVLQPNATPVPTPELQPIKDAAASSAR